MADPWTFAGAPPAPGGPIGSVTLLQGKSFCSSSPSGDVTPGGVHGMFHEDTRFISRWELFAQGRRCEPLGLVQHEPFWATFAGRARAGGERADPTLIVLRHRMVGAGMREDVELRNLAPREVECELELWVDTDLAGLFDVKEGRARSRPQRLTLTGTGLAIEAADESVARGTLVTGSHPVTPGAYRLDYRVRLRAGERWTTCLLVQPMIDGRAVTPRYRCGEPVRRSSGVGRQRAWRAAGPAIRSTDERLTAVFERAVADLGALRIEEPERRGRYVYAAGAPWFMTLFGRDALLTSLLALPLGQEVALETLRTLAGLQGRKEDPETEEQPGRIMHELRSGLDSTARGSAGAYYGTVDATPLFVMLLGELRRWGAPLDAVRRLLPYADAALEWTQRYGDRDGDGFVEYQRSTPKGLANQGWKDSWDGVTFADGALARPPIALCEVQGYVYAAHLARAELAEELGDVESGERLRHRAAGLRAAFNERFWLADRGWFAVGLDAEKRPIDALASNSGHCLWTGIVAEEHAPAVAQQLVSRRLFTGWGVRTLATSMGAFNPVSYHNGSVWPHDTAIAVAGLMRYGFVEEARRIAGGILDAAVELGRLPELFCGFDRSELEAPIPYPTACSPQAWAAAAPLLVLRSLLRLDADVPGGQLAIDPVGLDRLERVELTRIPLAGSRADVRAGAGGVEVSGVPEGLRVVRRLGPRRTAVG